MVAISALDSALALEGRNFARYRLERVLARGGMATVFLARADGSAGFERWFAVKVIHPHLADDARFVDMFLAEARIAARLDHPNICAVIDQGQEGGLPFLVMDYLRGQALSAVYRSVASQGPIPPWVLARVLSDAARGLHAAHAWRDRDGRLSPVVHRDVSPHNIFVLYDGIAKVVDFGIAKASDASGLTQTGELKGKFAYMSPEQLTESPVDARADVWALGVVLWEGLAGRRLFGAFSQLAAVRDVLAGDIPPIDAVRADCPPELACLVRDALTREAEGRVPSAAVFADRLDAYLAHADVRASSAQLSAWMRDRFAAALAEEEELLETRRVPPRLSAPVPAMASTEPVEGLAPDTRHVRAGAPWWQRATGVAFGTLLLVAVVAGVALWQRASAPSRTAASPPRTLAPVGTVPPAAAVTSSDKSATPSPAPTAEPVGSAEGAPAPASGSATDRVPDAGVEVPPARPPARRAQRGTGTLSLMAFPSATVVVRGERVGRTPLPALRLPSGRHVLTLRTEDGREKDLIVTIPRGAEIQRTVRF